MVKSSISVTEMLNINRVYRDKNATTIKIET